MGSSIKRPLSRGKTSPGQEKRKRGQARKLRILIF
jgi:hypothetical protein